VGFGGNFEKTVKTTDAHEDEKTSVQCSTKPTFIAEKLKITELIRF
jgi:hypothetical protein